MVIAINDTFQTLNELTNAIQSYMQGQSFKYSPPIIKPKLFTQECIGHKAFMCDSMVQAILRKKDNQWVIKKIKPMHKCPSEIHTVGINNYIAKKAGETAGKSVSGIVKSLLEKDVNVSYASVYEAFNNDKEGNLVYNYAKEFCKVNQREDIKMEGDSTYAYVEFTKLIKMCRPVVELKYVERHNGFVVLGIMYDPHDFPIVYNLCVSDTLSLKETYEIYSQLSSQSLNYITDTEKEFSDSFIKTRGLCKEVFKTEKDLKKIETLWGICNGYIRRKRGGKKKVDDVYIASDNDDTAYDPIEYDALITHAKTVMGVSESRFITQGGLFGLNNMPELDLEYIPNIAYQSGFIECLDIILSSLTISSLNEDINPSVRMQVERNIANMEMIDGVDLESFNCPCGRFNEFLIPCIHACAMTDDPMKHVSILYSKNMFDFEYNLVPVLENAVKIKLKVPSRIKKRKISKGVNKENENNKENKL